MHINHATESKKLFQFLLSVAMLLTAVFLFILHEHLQELTKVVAQLTKTLEEGKPLEKQNQSIADESKIENLEPKIEMHSEDIASKPTPPEEQQSTWKTDISLPTTRFQFHRGDGSVISQDFRLHPDGTVEGYSQPFPDERRWMIQDENLIITSQDGVLLTIFKPPTRTESGMLYFEDVSFFSIITLI